MNKGSPCLTCMWFKRTEFTGKTYAKCTELGIMLKSLPSFCNSYESNETASLRDMRQMAWVLRKDKTIGFESPVWSFQKPSKESDPPEFVP